MRSFFVCLFQCFTILAHWKRLFMTYAKITVLTVGNEWRNHARMVPVGITPIGTLSRDGRIHAFGRDTLGEYWIFGDGRPEQVPRIRIEKGLGALAMRDTGKTDDTGDESEN
jgi:hypothetical protein